MQWFRLFYEFAVDPKVQSLSENDQRRLIMIFCLYGSGELQKLTDDEIACALRIKIEDISVTKKLFLKKGVIDENWIPKNWEKRQFVSDSSASRMRKKRARDKTVCDGDVTSQLRHGYGHVTPPEAEAEAEADTETENKAAACNKNFLDELGKWFPPSTLNPTNGKLFRMFELWSKAKVAVSDISEAMKCKIAERETIKVPWYFEKIVIEFAEARKSGKKIGENEMDARIERVMAKLAKEEANVSL
jgi:hypothetical protein